MPARTRVFSPDNPSAALVGSEASISGGSNAQAADTPLFAPHTALVLEGGGMRGAYTSGLLSVLLEHDVRFGAVCGISAGSSCAVNYISRDQARLHACFVDIARDPRVGGPRSLLQGRGYFDADYLYGDLVLDGTLPFDWETFKNSSSELYIQAFERDSGRDVVWTKRDMSTLPELLERVRASCTMPFLMNPIRIDDTIMYDGGVGQGAGIPTHLALGAGYKRLLVFLSRPADYQKPATSRLARRLYTRLFGKYPQLLHALIGRPERYNAELELLRKLEAEGKAFVVRPEQMPIKNTTLDAEALEAAYRMGREQGKRECDRWISFVLASEKPEAASSGHTM